MAKVGQYFAQDSALNCQNFELKGNIRRVGLEIYQKMGVNWVVIIEKHLLLVGTRRKFLIKATNVPKLVIKL